MKKKILTLLFTAFLLGLLALPVCAQDAPYSLRLRRDWGTGLGSRIQGRFTLSISGDENAIQTVRYTLDGQEMASLDQAPFRFSFDTGTYAAGNHELAAQLMLKDGSSSSTAPLRVEFLAGDEARKVIISILLPIIAISLGASLVSVLVQSASARKAKAAGLQTTLARPSVCKHCGQAFSRPLIGGINLLTGKYTPCPHCGKWQIAKPASPAEVQEALEAQAAARENPVKADPQAAEREAIDDSKYMDGL